LSARGRFNEAIAESKTALEINPGSPWLLRELGRSFYLARRYDEAIVQFKRAFEADGNAGLFSGWLFVIYELKNDDAAAFEWFMKFQQQTNPERREALQNAYENSGWPAVRRKFLEFEKLNEQKPSVNYYRLARQSVLAGDKEQTFEYLNKAVEKHHGQLIMLNVEPPFDILRDDPRFDELVRLIGLSEN
jgi:adenylate cyclase